MKTAIKSLLSFLAISHSLAITWTRIGCDEPWSVDRIEAQGGPMTIDPNALWSNAADLSKGAREAIASLRGFQAIPSDARKQAGANANMVWNVDFTPHRGLGSDSARDMQEINRTYSDVESALAGNLAVNRAQRGFLFCGGRAFTRGRIPGFSDQPVWYATVIQGGPEGGPGTTDFIIPPVFRGSQLRPCEERGDQAYQGKTFYATKTSGPGPEESILGVILCPNQWGAQGYRVHATLDAGYTAQALDGMTVPYPAHYNSASTGRRM
ncbi:hypothetical protein NM208_g965 [Fusarium decemcellulare]|uniref:Uncharacterized protein n=1 Tax=Fusarium decemcellulare TaxID=57161 RepID=A0ACC1SXT9_9HYPO|nr:hypothetical protein NM208_g965 [Fusarium decemcellulare]